jgi:DNA polymerase elongation subunit (family B)
LEIELDAVYRSMLLLKKKKYAAIKVRQAAWCLTR